MTQDNIGSAAQQEILGLLAAGKSEAALIVASAIEDQASRETLVSVCKGFICAEEASKGRAPLKITPRKRIVLFSMGEYSDYGTCGFLRVDDQEYQQAIAEYKKLEQEQEDVREEVKIRTEDGDITRNQTLDLWARVEGHNLKRQKIWNDLQKKGTAVEHVEFWHEDGIGKRG